MRSLFGSENEAEFWRHTTQQKSFGGDDGLSGLAFHTVNDALGDSDAPAKLELTLSEMLA
jgi:hypothetical protein